MRFVLRPVPRYLADTLCPDFLAERCCWDESLDECPACCCLLLFFSLLPTLEPATEFPAEPRLRIAPQGEEEIPA